MSEISIILHIIIPNTPHDSHNFLRSQEKKNFVLLLHKIMGFIVLFLNKYRSLYFSHSYLYNSFIVIQIFHLLGYS